MNEFPKVIVDVSSKNVILIHLNQQNVLKYL